MITKQYSTDAAHPDRDRYLRVSDAEHHLFVLRPGGEVEHFDFACQAWHSAPVEVLQEIVATYGVMTEVAYTDLPASARMSVDRMDSQVKSAWLAALRSGEYTQTRERLFDGTGHCCLGVLCELAAKASVVNRDSNWFEAADDSNDYSETSLPQAVQRWAGLKVSDPEVLDRPLTSWNDDRKASFAEIANLIEEEL